MAVISLEMLPIISGDIINCDGWEYLIQQNNNQWEIHTFYPEDEAFLLSSCDESLEQLLIDYFGSKLLSIYYGYFLSEKLFSIKLS